jgi:hypothetical protein
MFLGVNHASHYKTPQAYVKDKKRSILMFNRLYWKSP